MRPSSSVTCEPGAERAIPWGRDLFTFVTSAAGHMMRTLQKPRKSRPSKRQVNHRRFLHNMIHRKFAEIEAANHQLASALFSRDNGDDQSLSPCQVVRSNQSDERPNEESSNVALCLPVLSPGDPEPETVTVEQSGLWAVSSHSLEHDVITGNANSETATDPPTVRKENLGRPEEAGEAVFGEPDSYSCFDFEVDPMKMDLMRFGETVSGKDNEQKNVQSGNRSQDTPSSARAEAGADATQRPCVGGALLRVPPALPSDAQSMAFCDFVTPSITDCQCSNTELNSIMESAQSHILDDSGVLDMNRSEEDCMDLQSLSISFWEAQDEGAESCGLNLGNAFLTYANSGSIDAVKNQQFNNRPIALSTNTGQSNNSSYDCMESLHRDTISTSDPHLDTLSHKSCHIDSRRPCKPNYCNKKSMALVIPYNEKYNADSVTTICPNLASFDLIRKNRGGENDAGREFSKLRSCSYELVRSSTGSMLYDDDEEQDALKELRLDGISTLEGNAACYKSYTSGYQREPTGSVHTFSKSCHGHQGASECTQRDSEEQTGLQGSGYWRLMSDIPVSHLHNHCGALNPATVQNSCGAYQNQNPFAGVARAFPASSAKRHLKCILTPPLEEDWLFDEIELK